MQFFNTTQGKYLLVAVAAVLLSILTIIYAAHAGYYSGPRDGLHSFWIIGVVLAAALGGTILMRSDSLPHATYVVLAVGVLLITVGTLAWRTNNRDVCLSSKVLAYKSGDVPDPDAFIKFYKSCPANPYHFDAVSEGYIRAYHKLPSWILSSDLYTDDPTGFVSFYRDSPDNPYLLNEININIIYDTRHLPEAAIRN